MYVYVYMYILRMCARLVDALACWPYAVALFLHVSWPWCVLLPSLKGLAQSLLSTQGIMQVGYYSETVEPLLSVLWKLTGASERRQKSSLASQYSFTDIAF